MWTVAARHPAVIEAIADRLPRKGRQHAVGQPKSVADRANGDPEGDGHCDERYTAAAVWVGHVLGRRNPARDRDSDRGDRHVHDDEPDGREVHPDRGLRGGYQLHGECSGFGCAAGEGQREEMRGGVHRTC